MSVFKDIHAIEIEEQTLRGLEQPHIGVELSLVDREKRRDGFKLYNKQPRYQQVTAKIRRYCYTLKLNRHGQL